MGGRAAKVNSVSGGSCSLKTEEEQGHLTSSPFTTIVDASTPSVRSERT